MIKTIKKLIVVQVIAIFVNGASTIVKFSDGNENFFLFIFSGEVAEEGVACVHRVIIYNTRERPCKSFLSILLRTLVLLCSKITPYSKMTYIDNFKNTKNPYEDTGLKDLLN